MPPKKDPAAKSKATKAELQAAAEIARQMKTDQTVFLQTTSSERATVDQKAAYEHYKCIYAISVMVVCSLQGMCNFIRTSI